MTGAWTPEKTDVFKEAFFDFLHHVRINSKELGGNTVLADHIYRAQRMFLDAVFDALSEDIHDIYVLKSRQLGLSTISRALSLFWLGMHDGLQGAMVFDTAKNTAGAKIEITNILRKLPPSLKFPSIESANRDGIVLNNGSQLLFMQAGVKDSKSAGGLGRSAGLNFAHSSEMCSWVNAEGIKSFRQSLSETYPDRLYIWESTARGFNEWYKLWDEAEKDVDHKKTVFLGWWSKDTQVIAKGTPDFARYGTEPPNKTERARMQVVWDEYGWEVTQEQLAWYRKKIDPNQENDEGDEEDSQLIQEQPWCAEEAFQQTGSNFFQSDKLTEVTRAAAAEPKPQAFRFWPGLDFISCDMMPAKSIREIDFRMWEEPASDACYVISADPAFGRDEMNNNSAAQVLRCYADGIDQVAEYASSLIMPHQFAWLLWTLIGYYGSSKPNCTVTFISEINGPGEEVWRQFQATEKLIRSGYLRQAARERGIADIASNVRKYVYGRSDSMSVGNSWQFKCLDVATPIPTPSGWSAMGDLKVGDQVFDETGAQCSVTGASPVWLGKPCYGIVFDDGETITADEGHLWQVVSCAKGKPITKGVKRLSETRDLEVGDCIPIACPLQTDSADLPVDPYVLGVWLGDGHAGFGMFTAGVNDIDEISGLLETAGASLSPVGTSRNTRYRTIYGLRPKLSMLGVLRDKHIPDAYLRASYDQRLALLQGLMDTDGTVCVSNSRSCNFSTTNYRLMCGVRELIRSLGIKPRTVKFKPHCVYKGKRAGAEWAYHLNFPSYPDVPIFRLQRKLSKQDRSSDVGVFRKEKITKYRRIVSIDPVESVPVRCIKVDSASHLYLAGHGMIATHNTNTQNKVQLMEACRNYLHNGQLFVRSIEAVEEMRTITRDGDSIGAEGSNRDDRTFALALGIRAWDEKVRQPMVAGNRTKQAERAKLSLSIEDQWAMFHQNRLQDFFAKKQQARVQAQVQMNRTARRNVVRQPAAARRW